MEHVFVTANVTCEIVGPWARSGACERITIIDVAGRWA